MYTLYTANACTGAVAQPPTKNRLLAALPAADYLRLLPHLEPVELPLGVCVYEPGDRVRHVHFPTAGIVAQLYAANDGTQVEIALKGNDGAVGITAFLGGDSTMNRALVVSAGHAYRLPKRILTEEFERGGNLQHLLLRYVQALLTQIAQTAVCNRHHTVEQQLCRWLLQSLDRLSGNDLHMTHDLIAGMLGVRREGVTEAAGRLQHDGLIQYRRGCIRVTDRRQLEQHVCECYAVVKQETERLLSGIIGGGFSSDRLALPTPAALQRGFAPGPAYAFHRIH